ncbi:MAG: S9 family peptidase [Patescibacteria group bacterium]
MSDKKYTIADFLEVKSSFAGRFSPDASRVAYLSDESGTEQIYIIPARGGGAVQLTDFPDYISGLIFSPTENIIVFSKSEGGTELDQLYTLNPDTKEIIQLTNDKKMKYGLGTFSYDGRFISYASNERNGTDLDIYIMQLATRRVKCVFDQGGWCGPVGFSPSGKYLMVAKNYSNEDNDLYLCDLETDEIEHVTPHTEKVYHGSSRWLPDESAFYVTMDKGVEFMSLARYAMKDKEFEYVLKPDWDIEGLAMQKDGKYLAITFNKDGYTKVTIHDPYTLKVLPFTLPQGEIGGISFSRDGSQMMLTLWDACRTTDIYVADMKTGVSRQLTHSHQGVPPEVLVVPELVRFVSFDGLEVPAFIFKPKNTAAEKKLPVIIYIHGGPESQYRPELAQLTQYFIYSGYMVVAPNVRGSKGYGKTYMALDNVEKRIDSVKDIVALREYLKTLPEVDTKKVVLYGGSYGGYMVLACMAFYPGLWAAGVDIVGIVNFVTYMENTSSYRRAAREAEYGSLEKDRKLLESISPIHALDKMDAPLFVIHGANDPRVPVSEAEQVVAKLREHGKDAELLVYPDEGHGLYKLKNRLDAFPKVVAFLEKELTK